MMDQLIVENGDVNVQQLPATDDEFGGVVVEMKEHMDSDVFRTLLKTSMSQWKLQVLFYIFSTMNFFFFIFMCSGDMSIVFLRLATYIIYTILILSRIHKFMHLLLNWQYFFIQTLYVYT